jgi:glyceraldehyde-3-phosphate dehydrogenase (NADP+)
MGNGEANTPAFPLCQEKEFAMEIITRIQAMFPREQDIPADVRLDSLIAQDTYLAGGELIRWDGPVQEVFSPVYVENEAGLAPRKLGHFPLLSLEAAQRALAAARAAYDNGRGFWPTAAVRERIACVEDFIFRLQDRKAAVVKLLMWEIGKSRQDSEKEFDRTVIYLKDTIEAYKELDRTSSRFVIQEGIIAQIRRAPLGVALCMGPFNYPLNETFTTLLPALIMGNCVVLKPPKLGVLLYTPLLTAFRDAFPAGVVNVIYGRGREIATPLMASGQVDVLAFIGTSKPADELKKAHPKPHRLRSVLGLEAKNPAIILPDADLELTVRECLSGSLSFNGQRCSAIKIIFAHTEIVDAFLEKFSAAIAATPIGLPWEEGVALTPLPEPGKPEFLTALVQDAFDQGAQVVNPGGGTVHHSFFYPAVVYPVAESMRLYHEEQFGPVIPVVPFDNLEIPINYIISSNYGQQASIFASHAQVIADLIDPLVNQVSRVNLNSQCQRGPDTFPWTGRKDSAEATLSVSDALRAFSIRTLVAAKATELNKKLITDIVREQKSSFLSTDFIL